MDIYSIVAKLRGPMTFNPAFVDFTEAEAVSRGLWPEGVPIVTPEEIQGGLGEVQKEDSARVIRAKYGAMMEAATADYLPVERETWYKQEKAAEAYALDKTILPYMQTQADARGVDVVDLMAIVQAKIDLYNTVIFGILGQQQKELDALNK